MSVNSIFNPELNNIGTKKNESNITITTSTAIMSTNKRSSISESSISSDSENDYSIPTTSINSNYTHNHCSNQKPLNVFNAYIVTNEDEYLSDIIPETKDISLPNHNNELNDINEISIDIGGSLAKIVYYTKDPIGNGIRLNFLNFETNKIESFIDFLKKIIKLYIKENSKSPTIIATGGGAHKFYLTLKNELNCKIQKEDEMKCLIIGLDFLISKIKNEIFCYDELNHQYIEIDDVETNSTIYPYLLVNIGSGVSMIKVTGPDPGNFERVGGSSLGGGTLWGLLSILTNSNTFDEMLEMASNGNNDNVDLLVGDIYGKGYNKIGLKSNHIASSMGKVFKKAFNDSNEKSESNDEGNDANDNNDDNNNDDNNDNNDIDYDNEENTHTTDNKKPPSREERLKKFNEEDIARSLLYAISNNIGQIAYLQAQRYDLKKIYFAGSYIRNHYQTIRTLSYAINFWSKGEKNAYFLKHEGYLGTLGAFLMRQNEI